MSDAALTSGQTTTEQPPSTQAPPGVSNEEYQRILEERDQWKQLAVNAQPTYQTYEQPAPQRASSYQDGVRRPPATLAIENPDEYDRQMDVYLAYERQQTLQAVAGFAGPQLAGTGKFMSQADPQYADVWKKYAGEIEQEMVRNKVPPHAQTKDAWDLLAGIVQGRHYRELADEIANQRLNAGGFGTESGSQAGQSGSGGGGGSLESFWAADSAWVQKAKASEMTLQSLRAHILRQGISEEKWVEDMTKGRSFSAGVA